FKLIEFFDDMRVELYNLREDVGEQHNLAAALPAKADELRARLHAWRAEVGAQMPSRNPNYDPCQPEHDPATRKKQETCEKRFVRGGDFVRPLIAIAGADRQRILLQNGRHAHGGFSAIAQAVKCDAVTGHIRQRFEPAQDLVVLRNDEGKERGPDGVRLAAEQ